MGEKCKRIARKPQPGEPLTPRQAEVLEGIAHGLAAKQLARELGIDFRTIESHAEKILIKLGANNSAHAVAIGIRTGLIPMMDPNNRNVRAVAEMMKKRWHEDIALGVDEDTRWKNAAAGLIIAVNLGEVHPNLNERPKQKPADSP